MSNGRENICSRELLERLAREGTQGEREVSIVTSPGARESGWAIKVKGHSSYNVYNVIAVEIDDQPGGLNRVLAVFDKSDINIEYMYAFVEKKADKAIVIFRIDKIQLAARTLEQNNISVLSADILEEL